MYSENRWALVIMTAPIYEEYEESGNDYSYYGVYDSALPENVDSILGIVVRATSFFENVIKTSSPQHAHRRKSMRKITRTLKTVK